MPEDQTLQELAAVMPEDQAANMFDNMDADENGTIELPEFLFIMCRNK
jgi:Ca2+-binding EF-hand superfamily protein